MLLQEEAYIVLTVVIFRLKIVSFKTYQLIKVELYT
jgi:hypothetical protein